MRIDELGISMRARWNHTKDMLSGENRQEIGEGSASDRREK